MLHFDLNKTLLAVDEVKSYSRDEVVYLEQWKSDPQFLKWAWETQGAGQDQESWTADLKTSINELRLIQLAHEYVDLDPDRKLLMQSILSNVDSDNQHY